MLLSRPPDDEASKRNDVEGPLGVMADFKAYLKDKAAVDNWHVAAKQKGHYQDDVLALQSSCEERKGNCVDEVLNKGKGVFDEGIAKVPLHRVPEVQAKLLKCSADKCDPQYRRDLETADER
ncbi:hypothetical protein BGX30_007965, partial [Mortierella sp. GBA39]